MKLKGWLAFYRLENKINDYKNIESFIIFTPSNISLILQRFFTIGYPG